MAPARWARCCSAYLPQHGQALVNCGSAGLGASLIYTIRLTQLIVRRKNKVNENETTVATIKRDDDRAGLFSVAFLCAAKTLRPGNTVLLSRTVNGTMCGCVWPIGDFCLTASPTTRPTPIHMSESNSVTPRSMLLGFSIAYSTRSQSSNVVWVCCWRDVISSGRRKKWVKAQVGAFPFVTGPKG